MDDEFIASVIAAYAEAYDPPTRTIRFSHTQPSARESAVVVYLPDEAEQLDPAGNVTLLGTAGFGSEALCIDFPCEFCIEAKGFLDEASADALAAALTDLALVPLKSGRLFNYGQILTNVSLPAFPRFTMAILIDWDSVDGFRFPEPVSDIGLLRVIPLFATEADYVESFADRRKGYLALINRGMVATDPDREPTV
ncbi:hypothetical protein [Streptomyces sp. PSAA01]|uniref:hypothetical protein n=1 Tax=Streptomyces sp. PSAA01 TaxID=2912762 RepID=UPI001F39E627|nr:hypothetical protein [Streptomyces sp. PSAA01]MCG0288584.1 hypothetical protein [Streptomyces sp. PSAA01]